MAATFRKGSPDVQLFSVPLRYQQTGEYLPVIILTASVRIAGKQHRRRMQSAYEEGIRVP